MRLEFFDNKAFQRGAPAWIEALWLALQALLFRSWIPGSTHRKLLLRLFGAKIGQNVTFKPGVRVKFPWKLTIGDHSWIGEDVWIDNLVPVKIGSDCCVSQGVYLCTGNHDWSKETFDLIAAPIEIGNKSWLCARSSVGPGVTIREGAVLGFSSVTASDLDAWSIYGGSPAKFIKRRII